jgi:hypothetical protein
MPRRRGFEMSSRISRSGGRTGLPEKRPFDLSLFKGLAHGYRYENGNSVEAGFGPRQLHYERSQHPGQGHGKRQIGALLEGSARRRWRSNSTGGILVRFLKRLPVIDAGRVIIPP